MILLSFKLLIADLLHVIVSTKCFLAELNNFIILKLFNFSLFLFTVIGSLFSSIVSEKIHFSKSSKYIYLCIMFFKIPFAFF